MKEIPNNNNRHKNTKKAHKPHQKPPSQPHVSLKPPENSLIDDIFKSAKHKKIVKQ